MDRLILISLLLAMITGCSSRTALVKYPNPAEKFIDIYGKIEQPLRYKIRVEYRTHAKLSKCTNYHIAIARDIAQTYQIDYTPEIKGDNHSITIPLQELDPNTICQWKPVMVSVCIGSATTEPTGCGSVFSFRGVHDIDAITTLECLENSFCFDSEANQGSGAINEFNKKYQLNLQLTQNPTQNTD